MDYNKWVEMQQQQSNPNPSTDPYAQLYNAQAASYSHYPYYPHHPHNSGIDDPQAVLKHHEIPSAHGAEPGLHPPGIDSYAALNNYSHSTLVDFETQAGVTYGHQASQVSALAAAAYYPDTGAAAQNWAAKEAVRQFGADPVAYAAVGIRPNGTDTLVTVNPKPVTWTNSKIRPINDAWRKRPKKTKIVQSAWCEVCKIDCNSKEVLDQHKLGKKHKKNLEKLEAAKKEANAPIPAVAPVANDPLIGPKENPAVEKGKTISVRPTKKKATSSSASGVDLETKRQKVMEGGAAPDAVKVCTICNVVCNSQIVFNYHLAGQKHIAMLKKQATVGTMAA
ncbi:PREDICTED: zinc finger RNA-binding protein 2-like [Nelumbo nucifera]|uniref:Zinc finger RNA-binding protein 2-like n=1 Tax=Nelumbo nucifera TaxID=4432 RepID=A0A1U8AAY1_NELNU|nr:PREDICTED: zinc finger RNA-binding protein 2-like [Nelumbo nucifera]